MLLPGVKARMFVTLPASGATTSRRASTSCAARNCCAAVATCASVAWVSVAISDRRLRRRAESCRCACAIASRSCISCDCAWPMAAT